MLINFLVDHCCGSSTVKELNGEKRDDFSSFGGLADVPIQYAWMPFFQCIHIVLFDLFLITVFSLHFIIIFKLTLALSVKCH